MGKGDNKPRGRMSAYAFFVQTCREEHKKKHPDESVVFAEFSRRCADRWKTMSDKEKTRFHQMADKDKKRYESEMANYKPSKNEKLTKGGKRKRTKDPNAPKRSLSAFFWFSNDERPKVKSTMPDSTVGDVAKELGKRWNESGADVRSKYEALAAKDKARYVKEVKAYKSGGAVAAPVKKAKGAKKGKKDSDESNEEEEEEEEEEEAEAAPEDEEEEEEEEDDD